MAGLLTIKITTGNDAFVDHETGECARILRKFADTLDSGTPSLMRLPDYRLRDLNGNTVGGVAYEPYPATDVQAAIAKAKKTKDEPDGNDTTGT